MSESAGPTDRESNDATMSTELDISSRIARKGLSALDGVLDTIIGYEAPIRVKFVREITEAIKAAAVVMQQEREQLEFEREHQIGELKDLLKQYLASLPPAEVVALVAEAAKAQEVRA